VVNRRSLLREWRARLDEHQRCLAKTGRWQWISRAYVRVLTYLLSQYGNETELDAELPQSRMPLYIAKGVDAGKPAKSSAAIRAVLEDLHDANTAAAAAGPLVEGRAAVDRVTVASYDNPKVAIAAFRRLRAVAIHCWVDRRWRNTRLIVRVEDLERARHQVVGFAERVNQRNNHYGPTFGDVTWIVIYGSIGAAASTLLAWLIVPDVFLGIALVLAPIGALAGCAFGWLLATLANDNR
jgi:hypothetical protein